MVYIQSNGRSADIKKEREKISVGVEDTDSGEEEEEEGGSLGTNLLVAPSQASRRQALRRRQQQQQLHRPESLLPRDFARCYKAIDWAVRACADRCVWGVSRSRGAVGRLWRSRRQSSTKSGLRMRRPGEGARGRGGGLRVESCCCGCTLKTGTIIIATLQALGGLGIALAMARNVLRAPPPAHPDDVQVSLVSGRNHGLSGPEARAVNRLLAELHVDARALAAGVAALGALQLVLSVALVYGANNEAPWLVRPWVVFAGAATLLGAGAYVAVALLTWAAGVEGVGAGIVIGLLPACGTMLYFILVVHSFYLQLLERPPGAATARPPPGPLDSPLVDHKGPPPAVL